MSPPPDSVIPSVLKGPLWRQMAISRAFLNIPSRVPSEGAPPRGPLHTASSEREAPSLEPLHPPLKVPSRQALLQLPPCNP